MNENFNPTQPLENIGIPFWDSMMLVFAGMFLGIALSIVFSLLVVWS
jgi:hypothetical protein